MSRIVALLHHPDGTREEILGELVTLDGGLPCIRFDTAIECGPEDRLEVMPWVKGLPAVREVRVE